MKYLGSIFLLFFSLVGSTQVLKSYYVLNDSAMYFTDQVEWDVKKENTNSVSVMKDGELVTYSSDMVTEFRTKKGETFEAHTLNVSGVTKRFFLEKISDGENKLFYLHDQEVSGYYFKPEQGELVKIEKNGFKEQLSILLGSCEAVKSSIKTAKFSSNYLGSLVERFNECSTDLVPEFRIGAIAGVNFSNENYTLNSVEFSSSLNRANYGIWMEFPLFRSKYFLHTEITVGRKKVEATTPFSSEKFFQSTNVISIPITLKYTSLNPKGGLFIHGGPQIDINSNSTIEFFENPPKYPQNGLGFICGFGYSAQSNSSYLQVEGRLFTISEAGTGGGLEYHSSGFGIYLIIGLF